MRKTNKKIISLFLLLIMIIAQLSPVFAADYATEDEVTTETYETLEKYLEVYFPNTALEDITELKIWSNSAKEYIINDMSGLSKLTNLTKLDLSGLTSGSVDVSGLTKLNVLNFSYLTSVDDNGDGYIYGIDNLENLIELYLSGARTKDLNFNKMSKLKRIYLFANRNIETTSWITVNGVENAEELEYIDFDMVRFKNIDFSNLKNLKYLKLDNVENLEGTYSGDTNNFFTPDNFSVEEMGINQLENLIEFAYSGIGGQELVGKLSFENSAMITRIDIDFEGLLEDDFFSNFCIDIRGKKLKSFRFEYNDHELKEEKFNLNSCILVDNYNELECTQGSTTWKGTPYTYSIERDFYYTIEQYIYDGSYHDAVDDTLSIYTPVKDYSGLSKFPNISWIMFNDMDLGEIDFTEMFSDNLKKLETIGIYGCKLTGNLNFSNYDSLKVINLNEITGDMSNITIDVRGLEYLSSFSFDANNVSNFELEKNILADSYFYRRVYISEENEYQVFRTVYKDIDEYLAENYPEDKKEDITFLSIWATIIDLSGLSELNSLEELYINNSDLNDINFGILPNLKSIHISNCNLDGTLDFRSSTKLKSIDITGEGDLSNTVIDIRRYGMVKLF